MKQNNLSDKDPRINLSINLNKFDIEVFKTQYDCLFRIINHISNYQRYQFNYYETRKFRYLRPINGNKLSMFRYAIETVIKKYKYMKGDYSIFKLSQGLIDIYQEEFQK
jgi:hypothetical protein